jgi:hypothetical protein
MPSEQAVDALADYVQFLSDMPAPSDTHWGTVGGACTLTTCEQVYGTSATPREARDFRILEATVDTLTLEARNPPGPDDPPLKCCFPGVVQFDVRVGNQWVVIGDRVGLLHAMKTDASGVCRPSCAIEDVLLVSRVREIPHDTAIDDEPIDDSEPFTLANPFPFAFKNPFFRFAINSPDPEQGVSVRDMSFRFSTAGSFVTLAVSTVTETPDVQPVSARYLVPTGELVVSDGSLEGLTLVDLNALTINRQFN